ncbi:DUF6387 family protein [Paraburkholderia aromaticivorans]|uniref:Uncharacterized protein n=1 Tax=Paraburkholderia aromaticivorans TaxID=2026199 RepID=A0A248VLX9_9BURK|nr:DUF6387 family protein [Paraburkholderia aromaticivorans]ASW00016.1 hypothetical protein CJU94_18805 [Paraburkholderia aromaticivorans]
MEKIEFGTSDLPDNFKLSRYDTCAGWGASEWWQALAHRRPIHDWSYLTPEEMAEDEDNPDLLDILQGNALAFLENPQPIVEGEKRPFPAYGMDCPIRDLTGADYYDGLFKMNSMWYETHAALARRACHRADVMPFEEIDDGADGHKAFWQLEKIPAWALHREASEPADRFCIQVQLGASDDDLVSEFKAWLKRIRKEAEIPQIPKAFDASHFSDWHERRLLPYLDLTLWARLHGGSFNLTALGYALFPDEALRGSKMRDVEPMVRRTIGPRARSLISIEVIATLNRQVWSSA